MAKEKKKPPVKQSTRPRGMTRAGIADEEVNTQSSAYRENSERMTVSMPRGMSRVLRSISANLDLEYSKVFRRALDQFIEQQFAAGHIRPENYRAYQDFKRSIEHW
jgi:hypothetical protein